MERYLKKENEPIYAYKLDDENVCEVSRFLNAVGFSTLDFDENSFFSYKGAGIKFKNSNGDELNVPWGRYVFVIEGRPIVMRETEFKKKYTAIDAK